MTFREIRISELQQYIQSDEYLSGPVIPISPQRAISQIHNPHAKPQDVALIIALDEAGNLVGYIGILPDRLSGDGERFAWNSCWWTDPEKGRGISLKLFSMFLQIWNKEVAFSDLTEKTNAIIEQLDFCEMKTRMGVRLYMRFTLGMILPRKLRILKYLKAVLSLTDRMLNLIWLMRVGPWYDRIRALHDYSWIETEVTDDEILRLITSDKDRISQRGKDFFSWLRQYPWIVEEKKESREDNYYFSSHALCFRQVWLKVYVGSKIAGAAFITRHDMELKVPYVFWDPDFDLTALTVVLKRFAIKEKLAAISCFHDGLAELFLENSAPAIYVRRAPRYTAISKKLREKTGRKFRMQDGDGDYVFT